jgi:carbon monoxide dehydrogenase subunit G
MKGRIGMNGICRFRFSAGTERETVEAQLAQAIVGAECVFGQARVRISAAYVISDDGTQVAIDASNEVGEHIAQLFTGLMTRQIGEDAFSVERVGETTSARDGFNPNHKEA